MLGENRRRRPSEVGLVVGNHRRKMCLFLALNLSDFALTWLLLRRSGGAYESNPAAAWCLQRFGWTGLIAFKLGMCLAATLLIVAVSRSRPRAAGRILYFACASLLAVVLYSGTLVPEVFAQAEREESIKTRREILENGFSRYRAYDALLNELRDQLCADRCTLIDAVRALLETEHARTPQWHQCHASQHSGYAKPELAAIRLIAAVRETPDVPLRSSALRVRLLEQQFKACFHRSAPAAFTGTSRTTTETEDDDGVEWEAQ